MHWSKELPYTPRLHHCILESAPATKWTVHTLQVFSLSRLGVIIELIPTIA